MRQTVPCDHRREVALLIRDFRTTTCGRSKRLPDKTLFQELQGLAVPAHIIVKTALVLVICRKMHRKIAEAFRWAP